MNCLKTAWSVTHTRCAVAVERPPEQGFLLEPVRCREHVPGAGRGEEDEGKARSVGGTRQTCREPCLVWGHAGAWEATLWSGEEGLVSHPALLGVLCSSGVPGGGRMDRIVAPAPRAPPCHPCHSHLARAVSLSLSCRVRRVWRPSFMVGGDQALAGGRVQVGRAPPGDTLAPQPSPSPPGNCVTCLPRVLAALLQGEEGESPPLAWL